MLQYGVNIPDLGETISQMYRFFMIRVQKIIIWPYATPDVNVWVEMLFRYLKYRVQEKSYHVRRVFLVSSFPPISVNGVNFLLLCSYFSHRASLI